MNPINSNTPSTEQKKTLWQAAVIAAIFVLILAITAVSIGLLKLMGLLSSVLVPLGAAAIIAILLNPLIGIIEKRLPLNSNRTLILVLGIFFGLGALLLYVAARSALSFLASIPELIIQFQTAVIEQLSQNPELADWAVNAADRFASYMPVLTATFTSFFLKAANSALSLFAYIAGFIFVPLYTYYILRNSETIAKEWHKYIPLRQSRFRDELAYMVDEISRYIVTYFRGQISIGFTIGAIIAVGLILLDLQYAILIGLFAGFVGLIPYLGAVMAMVPGVILAYAQSGGDWRYVLMVALVFVFASQMESLYVGPKIMGNRTGLHPMTIILSLFVWSAIIGGVLGLMMAVPLTATLRVLLQRYVWKREEATLNEPTVIP